MLFSFAVITKRNDVDMKRILVVEDELIINLDIKSILLHEEYIVDSAFNSTEAYFKISANDYDLILLDINLGGEGRAGIEIAKSLPSNQKIVFITAQTEASTVEELKRLSEYIINKPFSSSTLISTVKRVFSENS